MLSVADATQAVLGRVPRLAHVTVPLARARGRVLVMDVVAERALPGFDNSAMDGYAARASELPATLAIAGVVAAGATRREPVPAGAAVRIYTGAPMPADLDTVVMQEDATVDGERVALPAAPVGDNVRRKGEDIAIGDVVISAGTRLTAWHLGVLAALGIGEVLVARAPRVALIATGDELVDVHTQPGPGQLVDSSAHALLGLVEEAGGEPHYLGIARDEIANVVERLAAARDYDAVLTTGGVSVGDRDHVRAAVDATGIALELYKVAMKPGKPFSFGTYPTGTPFFGLPGNPVSTVVAFELFVRPALLAMQHAAATLRPRATVRLASGYRKSAGRAHYLRAIVTRDGDHLVATLHPKQGSAMLSSLVDCNALVEIDADTTVVAAGADVPALLLEAV
ncbi:MAG: molybdopterin molybdotransferase MoeA [Kofleriaceae bacterium]|nr:molybdopterin molybdotransferase MoeA [Kofleriaceae bacterium]